MAVVVKSNKTLQEALAAMLQKYRLRSQDVIVSMVRGGLQCRPEQPFHSLLKVNSLTFSDRPQTCRETFTDFPVS